MRRSYDVQLIIKSVHRAVICSLRLFVHDGLLIVIRSALRLICCLVEPVAPRQRFFADRGGGRQKLLRFASPLPLRKLREKSSQLYSSVREYIGRFLAPSLAPPTAAEEYCAVAALERANHEEKRRCEAGGPSRIRQMGERSPKRRQEDGRVRVLRILRERKARPSRFPCRRQQMANRSWLASSRRSIARLKLLGWR
jgi:hypothetical protein